LLFVEDLLQGITVGDCSERERLQLQLLQLLRCACAAW
jgi:hypothetical protein